METIDDGQGGTKEAAYVYLGGPRRGVEVLKLSFPNGSATPTLEYVGRIQTPGDASRLHIEEFENVPGYPRSLLYVGDYEGGIRIYQHPASQGGN